MTGDPHATCHRSSQQLASTRESASRVTATWWPALLCHRTAQPTRATSLRAKADPLPPRESQAVARHKRRFEASRRFRHAAQGRAAALKAAERDEPSSARGVIPATPRGARPADRVRSASPVARGHVNAIELRGRSPVAAHTRRADEYTPAELHALLALPRVVYAHGETGLPQNYGLWRGAASEYVRSPS